MFTGLIEEMGTVKSISKGRHSARVNIAASKVLEGTKIGDSIAVNGICLTVNALEKNGFSADVMHETLNRSTLGKLTIGKLVNLERAMPADGRFGGHIVTGHIDGVGKIVLVKKDDIAIWYTIELGENLIQEIVEKGSVTIDGISLTVGWVEKNKFAISAIPHTVANTTLQDRKVGDGVNIETDILGKYIKRILHVEKQPQKEGITLDFLTKYGF